MQDASSVITQAANGHTADLAQEYEVSLRRMYEILGPDCPYPKAKRLIRTIARFDQDGARLIKADLDAMFEDILDASGDVSDAELHREASEAVQSVLDNDPPSDQKRELLQLIVVAERKVEIIDQTNITDFHEPAIRRTARTIVRGRK